MIGDAIDGEGSGPVRQLSREEIEELLSAGKITPIDQIGSGDRRRISFPELPYTKPYMKLSRDGR